MMTQGFHINDAFTQTTTLRLLPTQYRAHQLAQMETLRLAGAYKARYYNAPDPLVEPIAPFSQVETQIRAVPGTCVWGISCFSSAGSNNLVKVQVTDSVTEIPLFSDYIQMALMNQQSGIRFPLLIAQPRVLVEPGQINVEVYNDTADNVTVQWVLYCAEPVLVNPDLWEGNHNIQKYRRQS